MHVDGDGVVLRSHCFARCRGLGGWLCGLRCSVKFRSRRMPRTLPVLRRSASAQPVAPGRAHESCLYLSIRRFHQMNQSSPAGRRLLDDDFSGGEPATECGHEPPRVIRQVSFRRHRHDRFLFLHRPHDAFGHPVGGVVPLLIQPIEFLLLVGLGCSVSIKNCCVFVIMLSHNISHLPCRVGHAGQASESRRQLLLAVALGARSAWSMASGGGCVAGRASNGRPGRTTARSWRTSTTVPPLVT
jgi:hypothetical protein